MSGAAKQINVLAKLSEITEVCRTKFLFYEFPETSNTIQIGTVWRQIDKIDSNSYAVLLNEFAPLLALSRNREMGRPAYW